MFCDDEMTSCTLILKPGFGPSALLLFNWFSYPQNQSQTVALCPRPTHPSQHVPVLGDAHSAVPDT